MTDIAFYHLTASSADDALPQLLSKTVAAGKKAMVVSNKNGMMALSAALWSYGHANNERKGMPSYAEGSWLPHGLEGKDNDDASLCPIWFSGEVASNQNNAEFAFYLDEHVPQDVGAFDRVFVLFNGLDDAAVTSARSQWKDLRAAGHALSYWTQDDRGKWEKTA